MVFVFCADAIGSGGVVVQSFSGCGRARLGAIRHLILTGLLSSLSSDSCRRSETDSPAEEQMGVFAGEGARSRQFVGVSVGVEEFEGHFGPGDLHPIHVRTQTKMMVQRGQGLIEK